MDESIQISRINDFIFCPYSLYLHSIYESFDTSTYHSQVQKVGQVHHEKVDKGKYSTSKHILQGTSIYSEKYNLTGKLDIFDIEKGYLVERKYKLKKIFDGHRYQLYAEYFCLKELGYEVKKMFIQSLSDNKRYEIQLPNKSEVNEFEKVLQKIREYSPTTKIAVSTQKCKNCIYNELCEYKQC